jgi:hypothetical protein
MVRLLCTVQTENLALGHFPEGQLFISRFTRVPVVSLKHGTTAQRLPSSNGKSLVPRGFSSDHMDCTSPPRDEDSDEGPVRGDLVSVRQDLLFGPSVKSASKTRRAAAVCRHQAFMVSEALDA